VPHVFQIDTHTKRSPCCNVMIMCSRGFDLTHGARRDNSTQSLVLGHPEVHPTPQSARLTPPGKDVSTLSRLSKLKGGLVYRGTNDPHGEYRVRGIRSLQCLGGYVPTLRATKDIYGQHSPLFKESFGSKWPIQVKDIVVIGVGYHPSPSMTNNRIRSPKH
jgi:hypothetical protein